jgi:SAM-dependent methyltransferase
MDAVQIALLVIIVVVIGAIYFFFASFAVGAGYQPTPRRIVRAMLALAAIQPNEFLYDLGAGTGALVFPAATRYHARVVAVELEPLRVLILRLRRALSPARGLIEIRRANLFAIDLAPADIVVVFLWPGAMERLRPQFERQLKPGARIVSYWHPIPDWVPERFDRDTQVYLYRYAGPLPRVSPPSPATARSGGT